ncbi:GNAT family N-acetyltransferase [Chitinivorax sp. B]|uniref:GNAT family N-acetyltransferase n=1 Tax=Chitinivorax sp. B TaxID=2502235 RepID=UPI0010F5F415|nr:GNAT family N-acetyltransferase [Chitinivorax sp. B]
MKELLKSVARALLGEYSIYYILTYEHKDKYASHSPSPAGYTVALVDETTIRQCTDPLMQAQAHYAGDGSLAYACLQNGHIVGLCFYWFGARYLRRNFWPLKENEVKLVQIVTAQAMREKKVAYTLLTATLPLVLQHGFDRAYARVWHSNKPSMRAFFNAGWTRHALVIEVRPFGRKQPLRFCFLQGSTRLTWLLRFLPE